MHAHMPQPTHIH